MKLGERLERLKQQFPKRSKSGLMYHGKLPTKALTRIKVYVVLVSDEGLAELTGIVIEHPSIPKKPNEWKNWLAKHFKKILAAVISSQEQQTGELWKARGVLGWADDNYSTRANARKKRNKSKQKRKTNVPNRIRRR